MSRSSNRRVRAVVAAGALALLLVPSTAFAQVPKTPPLPVAPGLPQSVPASSTASGAIMAPDLELQTLTTSTQDPTALSVAPDGRVVFAERQGAIKVITTDGKTVEAGRILTNATGCAGCPDQTMEEGGIHGLELAPNFAETGRFYAYYSVPFSTGVSGYGPDEAAFRLSTFVLTKDNKVEMNSERVLLTNPAETKFCCHYGGDIDFLPDGTILLSVGDDTSPRVEGFNPRDKRPGMQPYDADRTSQNPKDRRGKVLRLMPDGSVPDGSQPGIAPNPHVGEAGYDPYVYAMGFRSDYRMAVDDATGFTFVGNVGPDAATDSPTRGPRGHDELEVIPPGGGTNHGWPHCIGDNIPYLDYDYATQTSGAPLSCEGFEPAVVYYPNSATEKFPQLGAGGRTALGGVVYRYQGTGQYRLADKYQGQLFFMEWSRDKIFTLPVITGDVPDAGSVDASQMTLVGDKLFHPIDATVGPDGAIYLAEYGRGFYFTANARISRIVPKAASTAPAATATGDGTQGAGLPLLPLGAPLLATVAALAGARRRRSVVV